MHEQNNIQLAESSSRTRISTQGRPTKWPDAKRPMATGSKHNGCRMEHSTESSTGREGSKSRTKADVERVCPSRNSNHPVERKSCSEKSMVSVGNTSNDDSASLCPKEKAGVAVPPKPTGRVNTQNVLGLLEHQQYCCALSGRMLTPESAALDHIVPIRFDGEHVIENTQVLHKDVNRAKGSLENSEFIQLCHEVVLWSKMSISKEEL